MPDIYSDNNNDYVWIIYYIIYSIIDREKGESEQEKERTTCSNALENKTNYALLQSFNRTLNNRLGIVAVTVKKYENRYARNRIVDFWSAVLLPICRAFECTYRS